MRHILWHVSGCLCSFLINSRSESTSTARRQERHQRGNGIVEHRKNYMRSPIHARTTIISSSCRTPHGLCSYNLAPTGWWKYSGHSADSETDNDSETRYESNHRMLQNHFHCGNGDGDWSTTIIDSTPNESPSFDHAHAITLPETSYSRMVNKRPANKDRLHRASIESRKYTATISTYMWKDWDNRAVYSTLMVDINYKDQNRENKKGRENPARQNSNASRCHNDNNLHRRLRHRE